MPKFVLLWTDAALFLVLAFLLIYAWRVRRLPALRASWREVFRRAPAACSALVLLVFGSIALLDSVHFRPQLPPVPGAAADAPPSYAPVVRSALDLLLDSTALASREKTYSAPLSAYQFTKESLLLDGITVRDFPRLRYGGAHLDEPERQRGGDIARRTAIGAGAGVLLALLLAAGRRCWAGAGRAGGRLRRMCWHGVPSIPGLPCGARPVACCCWWRWPSAWRAIITFWGLTVPVMMCCGRR
ncbi:hypothetical protein [Kerstersia sp.]|uniref:hypothetical protein n=1 Tax=Kerstersia sp. TaxID=1930783 RepID=UPI003F92DE60